MGLSAFEPQLMSKTPFGGVNLAIIYGFGLIVAALVLALIYVRLCRSRDVVGEAPMVWLKFLALVSM